METLRNGVLYYHSNPQKPLARPAASRYHSLSYTAKDAPKSLHMDPQVGVHVRQQHWRGYVGSRAGQEVSTYA